MVSSEQKKHSYKLKKFLFPLYPVNVLRSTKTLTTLAILISLRIIFNLFSIPIPGITQTISFSWVPLMVIGWYFGPVLSFFIGWITDTLCYLIFTSGLWFWMYSIQEPCVCVIAGIFGSICRLRSNEKCNIVLDILIQQIIYIIFSSICYISLILWLSPNNNASTVDDYMVNAYKYTALVLITVFMVVMEYVTFYQVLVNKNNHTHLVLFIYGTCLVVLLMEIFSFLLGPISTLEYYKYMHNGRTPSSERFLKYGTIIYLIPRVIVQCVKTPLESFLLVGIVWSLNPSFTNILNNLNNKWEIKN